MNLVGTQTFGPKKPSSTKSVSTSRVLAFCVASAQSLCRVDTKIRPDLKELAGQGFKSTASETIIRKKNPRTPHRVRDHGWPLQAVLTALVTALVTTSQPSTNSPLLAHGSLLPLGLRVACVLLNLPDPFKSNSSS